MLSGERWYPGRVTYTELTHLICDINHRRVYAQLVIKVHTEGRVTILLPPPFDITFSTYSLHSCHLSYR